MQRLAALVPRPRLHLIRFHGLLAPNAKLRRKIVSNPPEQATAPACDHAPMQGAPARLSWARLLKRVFDIDIKHCPNCGGSLKIIAAIEDPAVIVKIFTHLGLSTRTPPRAPAQRFDLFQSVWEPKTACQSEPTEGLALSASERCNKERFVRVQPLYSVGATARPSPPGPLILVNGRKNRPRIAVLEITKLPVSLPSPTLPRYGHYTYQTVCVPGCGGKSIPRYLSLKWFFHNCLITNDL